MKPLSKQLQITKGRPEAGHSPERVRYTSQEHRLRVHTDVCVQPDQTAENVRSQALEEQTQELAQLLTQ